MSDDPALFTLTELAAAIAARRISSVEATRALLARIERWQPVTNAFVRIEAEEALAAAADADAALDDQPGPLAGVPLAHKDMYYVAGKPAGCGAKIRDGFIAPATSTAIARLAAAGATRLGALHMVEFAYGPTGHNVHLGDAHNPHDPSRITGGSSSGSGAAVAARLVPAALGSDTGGSIRLPAHYCGVSGLKPTYGRVSRAHAMPLSFSLDTVGPLARSAADCGLILSVISGPDPLDPTTASAPAWNTAAAARSAADMTIGIPKAFYVEDLAPEVAAAFDAAIATFRRLGARIVAVDLPDQAAVSAAQLVLLAVEATSLHRPWLVERPQDYGPPLRTRLHNGLAYSAVEYVDALRWRGPALAAHLAAIGEVDAILTPAAPTAAPTLAESDLGSGAEAMIQAMTKFLRPVNYLGLPALVVPAGFSGQGLPVGVQLIGRPFGDEALVALGAAFQAATDHHQQVPVLA